MKTLGIVSALIFSITAASGAFAGDGAEGGASLTQTQEIVKAAEKKNIETSKNGVREQWPPHHTGRLEARN